MAEKREVKKRVSEKTFWPNVLSTATYKIQAPGLSATHCRLTAPPAGTTIVSRLIGFVALNQCGGLRSGSDEVTSLAPVEGNRLERVSAL